MIQQSSNYGRIRNQLVGWFLLCGLLPMIMVSAISYSALKAGLLERVTSELHTAADNKAAFIYNWFEYRWMDLTKLARSQTTIHLLKQLRDTPEQPIQDDGLGHDFKVAKQSYDYIHDLLLIDTSGDVLYSIVRSDDLDTNLITGKYAETGLAKSVQRTLNTQQASFSDFERYPSSALAVSGFLSAPVLDSSKQLLGVLAIQIRLNRITNILASNEKDQFLHYLVGEDALLRTPIEKSSDVLNRAINSLLVQQGIQRLNHPDLMNQGLFNQEYIGPSGRKTIGYMRPIEIGNVRWVLMTETDRKSILAKAHWLSRFEISGILITAIIVTFFSLHMASRISRPVSKLVEASQALMDGDFDQKVEVDSRNEIGKLAHVFNLMVDKRKQYESDLIKKSEQIKTAMLNLEEERYALSKHAIVATTDARGTITYVNSKFEEVSGYSKSELVGQNHRILNSGKHPKEFFHEMYSDISRGRVWSGEICNRAKQGHLYWVYTTIAPFKDDKGRIDHYIAIRTDMSAQKMAMQELERAKQAAEQATLAKSEFLASMSHEIRTPMNGVLGMLNLLMHSDLNPDQQHQASLALSSAESLLVLINDILDFSKVEAGKLKIEMFDFDLTAMLGEFAEAMAEKAQRKGLELMLDVSSVQHTMVRGDPGRLRQILTNLVSNAIKFTADGEIVISVNLEELDSGALKLKGSVRDTGLGIEPDKLSCIFEAFTQVDASTTRQSGGTGLGLSIVKKLSQAMGGDVFVHSEPGVGSTFTFDLLMQSSTQSKLLLPTVDVRGVPILIVDDNATNREVLRRQLQNWGAVVTEAESGKQALELLDQVSLHQDVVRFKVGFVDYQMPEMDGATLGRAIRADSRYDSLKLIMMTSIANRGDGNLFSQIGFDGYFPKPATTSDLFRALAVLIAGGDVLSNAQPLVTQHYLRSLESEDHTLPDAQPPTAEWPDNTRLLLVEDNTINQNVALGLLEDLGLPCEIANNGVEALDKLHHCPKHAPFTLVFMDCQMPEMDGYEATRLIRQGRAGEEFREIPIIAMTANAMKGDRERCLQAGMSDYLSKPIGFDCLANKLTQWLVHSGEDVAPLETTDSNFDTEWETWDQDALLKRVRGKPERVGVLVGMFLEQAPEYLAHMERAIADRNSEQLTAVMHTLKGTAGNLGAQQLMKSAEIIELASRADKWQKVTAYQQSVQDNYKQLEQKLRDYLAG